MRSAEHSFFDFQAVDVWRCRIGCPLLSLPWRSAFQFSAISALPNFFSKQPHFPALHSDPMALQGLPAESKLLAAELSRSFVI